jgi:SRSO17 transposase
VVQIRVLAGGLPDEIWQTVHWREGVAEALTSRFAAVRVRPAQGDAGRSEPRAEHWLLVEWPNGEAVPTKFWLSTLPEDTAIEHLVRQAKQHWLIERDYLELKQELGLGHYEGRGWLPSDVASPTPWRQRCPDVRAAPRRSRAPLFPPQHL